MIRIIAVASVLLAGPAWAGCANYIDGSLSVPPPRVEICYAGECEETVLEYECGNAHGAFASYANGWHFSAGEPFSSTDETIVTYDGARLDESEWGSLSCHYLDDDLYGCPFINSL